MRQHYSWRHHLHQLSLQLQQQLTLQLILPIIPTHGCSICPAVVEPTWTIKLPLVNELQCISIRGWRCWFIDQHPAGRVPNAEGRSSTIDTSWRQHTVLMVKLNDCRYPNTKRNDPPIKRSTRTRIPTARSTKKHGWALYENQGLRDFIYLGGVE